MATPSPQDMYDLGVYTLQARRPSLIVNPGDVTDAVVNGCVSMATAVIGYGANRFAAATLDGAEGDDLSQTTHDRGVDRDEGEEAKATLTLARPTALAGAGTIPTGFRVGTQPDDTGAFVTFTIDNDVPFAIGQLTATVTATCAVQGKVGNVVENTITRLLDTPFDTTLTATNAARAAGGDEEESDPDLRDRTRGNFLQQRRGTEDALVLAAKTPGTGVKRASTLVDPTTGIITLFVSDADGNANAAMVAAVQKIIDRSPSEGIPAWRAAGDVVNVVGAVLLTQDITVQLVVRAGVDINTLVTRVIAAVTTEVARLQPGDVLYTENISRAARGVDQYSILRAACVIPAVSIAPGTNQVIRAGVVSVTG